MERYLRVSFLWRKNMATSKIKTIEKTLRKAIDYIVNPDKTNGGQLVYSHGCSVETADLEMDLTARKGTGRGSRIAYHLIQSFALDDDISPEKALELGIEFAKKVTGGNYEFIVTTHIDKDHIHNHIIFNSVDYVKHRKYHSDEKDKYRIRDINDEICKANNLSVLPKYVAKRNFRYKNIYKNEDAGWKEKLKIAIDKVILEASSFEDFLFAMEMEGYKIKRGKHIAFHAPGQKRKERDAYTRSKTIGGGYTEDEIRERIENKDNETVLHAEENAANQRSVKTENSLQKQKNTVSKKKIFSSKRINLLVDIKKNIKAQQSKGYEQALVRSNINTLVKTMNFLIAHNLTTSEDFQNYAEGKQAEYSLYRDDIKKLERELLELSEKIKFTQNYKKNAYAFYESKRVKDSSEYIREHESQIILFKSSEIYFKRKQLDPKEINLSELFEQYKRLTIEKQELSKKSRALSGEINEIDRVAENVTKALGINFGESEEKHEQEDYNAGRENERDEDKQK